MTCRATSSKAFSAALVSALIVLTAGPTQAASAPGWTAVVPKSDQVTFSDIEAVSTSNVWAVGARYAENTSPEGVAYHWNGTSMTEVTGADPGPSTTFSGVLALAPDNVWIVGGEAWARHWDGSSWTTVGLVCCYLNGIDGVAANDIWVIGSDPLFEHWNGSAWSVVAPGFTASANPVSIDMVSANDGWAAGSRNDVDANPRPFLSHWNGATWSEVAVPATDPGALRAVRAFGPNDVYVAGWTQGASDTVKQTLVMHWNGSTWTRESTPDLGSLANDLTDIDGTSGADLWAVGGMFLDEKAQGTLGLHRDASGWSVVSTPNDPTWPLRAVGSAGVDSAWAAGGNGWTSGGPLLSYGDAIAHDSSVAVKVFNANWGSPVPVRGTLTFTDGAFAGGQQIDIQRSGPDGTIDLAPLTTGLHGEFTLDDVPSSWGTFTYTATFAGDATWSGSSAAGTGTLWGRQTTVSMKSSASTVTYGKAVKLSVHVKKFTPGAGIGLYAKIGKTKKLVAKHPLDGDGNTTFSVKPSENTTYLAMLESDPMFGPSGYSVDVEVRAAVTASSLYQDGAAAPYALYHYDAHCPTAHTGCPMQLVVVRPVHSDVSVWALMQARVNGSWAHATDAYFRLNAQGKVKVFWYYTDRSIIGVPFRVRYEFLGDKDHVENWSNWVYFKVVN